MRLHVHRSGDALLEALAAESGCYYATFGRSATAPGVLRSADAIGRERSHRSVAAVESLRMPAEALLRAFFDAAARSDLDLRYAHSARVLLAVPDYPDLALVFLLRALRAREPGSTVHALAEDASLAALLRSEAEGGEPPVFRGSATRACARASRSLLRSLANAAPGTQPAPCDVLIVTLGESVANGGPDAYFGDFADTLRRTSAVHTVYAAPGKRLRLPASASISPLEAYVRPVDVLRALRAERRDARANAGARGADAVLTFLRAREHAAGEPVMLRIMAQAFERMLAAIRPARLLYPFENRTWEKSLLRAARAQGGIRCIGYQHSSITPRHLALCGASDPAPDDLPDAIVTCGEVTAGMIRAEMPQARARVTVGAALRARRLSVPAPRRGVLAPISSSRAEAWEMLRLLHEASAMSDHPIIVRTHPTIPVEDLYAQFDWPAHVRLSRGRALAEDFAETGAVVYSSSTVALEGLLYGRLPVYLEIGDIPSGDPMHGDHAFVFRASGARELAAILERIAALSPEAGAALRAAGRAYAERYLIEPGPANVERMAAEIAQC